MTDQEAVMWARLFWLIMFLVSMLMGMMGMCFGSFAGGLICVLLGLLFLFFAGSYK